ENSHLFRAKRAVEGTANNPASLLRSGWHEPRAPITDARVSGFPVVRSSTLCPGMGKSCGCVDPHALEGRSPPMRALSEERTDVVRPGEAFLQAGTVVVEFVGDRGVRLRDGTGRVLAVVDEPGNAVPGLVAVSADGMQMAIGPLTFP